MTLRFRGEHAFLEENFRRFYYFHALPQVRAVIGLLLIVFALPGVFEGFGTCDARYVLLGVRGGVLFIGALYLVALFRSTGWFVEHSQTTLSLLTVSSAVALGFINSNCNEPPEVLEDYMLSDVDGVVSFFLFLICSFLVLRLRFVYATVTGIISLVLYAAITWANFESYIHMSFLLGGLAIASNLRERSLRMDFLLHFLLHEERLRSKLLTGRLLPPSAANRPDLYRSALSKKDSSLAEYIQVTSTLIQTPLGQSAALGSTLDSNMNSTNSAVPRARGVGSGVRWFNRAIILFCGIVDFERYCDSIATRQLVAGLTRLWTALDRVAAKNSVEKLENVGSVFVAAKGLHKHGSSEEGVVSELFDVVRCGQEMLEVVQTLDTRISFHVRVGIHVGPAMGGFIGNKSLRFTLMGDTINMASRVMTSTPASHLRISQPAYEYLCMHTRGNVFTNHMVEETVALKGKGDMTTYLLSMDRDDSKSIEVVLSRGTSFVEVQRYRSQVADSIASKISMHKFSLAFVSHPSLERLYKVQQLRLVVKEVRIALMFGLIVFIGYMYTDFTGTDSDDFAAVVAMRHTLVVLIAAGLWLTYQRWFTRHYHPFFGMVMSLAVLSFVVMGMFSYLTEPGNFFRSNAKSIYIVFFTLTCNVSGLPFLHSAVVTATAWVYYNALAWADHGDDFWQLFALENFFLVVAVIINVVAAYWRDYYLRRAFLLQLAFYTQKLYADTLAQRMLPPFVIKRMQDGEESWMEAFDRISVLQMDIMNFTEFASNTPLEEVVIFLDRLYGILDELTDAYEILKIEIIGDAYVAVAGLPFPAEELSPSGKDAAAVVQATSAGGMGRSGSILQHKVQSLQGTGRPEDASADVRTSVRSLQDLETRKRRASTASRKATETPPVERLLHFALDIVDAIKLVPTPSSGKRLNVRVGVATGPILAGILGTQIPRYHVWGRTVTLAEKLERSCFGGRIHVCESTYRAAKVCNRFVFQPRYDDLCDGSVSYDLVMRRPASAERARLRDQGAPSGMMSRSPGLPMMSSLDLNLGPRPMPAGPYSGRSSQPRPFLPSDLAVRVESEPEQDEPEGTSFWCGTCCGTCTAPTTDDVVLFERARQTSLHSTHRIMVSSVDQRDQTPRLPSLKTLQDMQVPIPAMSNSVDPVNFWDADEEVLEADRRDRKSVV